MRGARTGHARASDPAAVTDAAAESLADPRDPPPDSGAAAALCNAVSRRDADTRAATRSNPYAGR